MRLLGDTGLLQSAVFFYVFIYCSMFSPVVHKDEYFLRRLPPPLPLREADSAREPLEGEGELG